MKDYIHNCIVLCNVVLQVWDLKISISHILENISHILGDIHIAQDILGNMYMWGIEVA